MFFILPESTLFAEEIFVHETKEEKCQAGHLQTNRDIERKFDPGYSRFFKEYKRKVEAQYKVQQGFHVPTLKLRIQVNRRDGGFELHVTSMDCVVQISRGE